MKTTVHISVHLAKLKRGAANATDRPMNANIQFGRLEVAIRNMLLGQLALTN
jgi:hypothetical protein